MNTCTTYNHTDRDVRARAQSRFRPGRQRWFHLLQARRYVHVGIRALDWRRPASREGRDASQERTLILNRGPSCSERQFNERVFRGRITVVHPSRPVAQIDSLDRSSATFAALRHSANGYSGHHGEKDRDQQICSWIFVVDRRSRYWSGIMPIDSQCHRRHHCDNVGWWTSHVTPRF